MELRGYQVKFIEAVESGWKEFRKQLGVAPTGAGKTIIFSSLAKRRYESTGQKTCILAHREELIDQAIKKLHAATGIVADKEKAEYRARLSAPVVVASVQTMMRRLERWNKDHFGLVIADEAHHALSKSWRTVLDHFSGAHVLGVTATPDRGDKRDLSEFFENIPYQISLKELIKERYLCPIEIRGIPLKIDLSGVGTSQGDLDSTDLGHALEPYLDQIAVDIKARVGNRKTLAFLPLIATSKKFVESCHRAGLTAEHVDGESDGRQSILKAFGSGEFQVLSNAMLLLEGYDQPDISAIAFLRPTKIRSLFAQGVGRGTRIFEGKENLMLLDFLWLHSKHDLAKPASLIAESEEEAEAMTELIEEQAFGEDEEEVDLMEAASEAQAKREEALRKKLLALSKKEEKYISAEEFALEHNALQIAEFEPTMRWHYDPPTPAQLKYIEKAGIDVTTIKNKGQASVALDVVFKESGSEPASSKQKWVMNQAGWRSKDNLRGPFQATREDARQFFASRNENKNAGTKPDPKQPEPTFWE